MFESSLRGAPAGDDERPAAAGAVAGDQARAPESGTNVVHDVPATGPTTPAAAVRARLDELAGSLAEVSAAADQCATWTGAERSAVLGGIDRLAALLTTTR